MLRLMSHQGGPLWHSLRDDPNFLSSTEIPAVMDVSPFKSRANLFGEKIGVRPKRDDPPNYPMQRGLAHEQAAIDFFLSTDIVGSDGHLYVTRRPGSVLSWTEPITCSPDSMFVDIEDHANMFGLEVKVPFIEPAARENVLPKVHHLVQCQTCLYVTEAKHWWLLYYYPECVEKSRLWKISPNVDFHKRLVREATYFLDQLKRGKYSSGGGYKSRTGRLMSVEHSLYFGENGESSTFITQTPLTRSQ